MTAPSKRTRAALYARVSTLGHGQDVELQPEELRQAAASRGWVIVEELVDHDVAPALAGGGPHAAFADRRAPIEPTNPAR